MPKRPPATRDRLTVNHLAIAVCDVYVFRLCGSPQTGFKIEGKDLKSQGIDMIVECLVSGYPACPGANDQHIHFPKAAVFKVNMLASFVIEDAEIEKAFGMKLDKLHVESDGELYEVTLAENGWPVGEIVIRSWKLPPTVPVLEA